VPKHEFTITIWHRIEGLTHSKRILIVEPNAVVGRALATPIEWRAAVEAVADFETARDRLMFGRHDLLVTRIRLEAFNGLHLVHLAKLAGRSTKAIAYDEGSTLARDVRAAGAFFELASRMPIALPSYIEAALPAVDRRAPGASDRRSHPRGGRRAWDQHVLASAAAL
jgi:DNA-binding NtrC family response regulator